MLHIVTPSLLKLSRSFLIIINCLLLFACQKENRYAGKSIFRYNIQENITSLDPAFARSLDNVSTVNQLFNGLVQLDSNLKMVPCIANSWTITDSGTTYTFQLRKDVFFHNNGIFGADSSRRVIAADFIYSLNRLIDPSLISPGNWVMNAVARKENGQLSITAIDENTLQIHLRKAFPPFLGILSMQYCSVIPKEAVDFYGNSFRSHPIGTGPFLFKYWKENSKLILLKNKNYFEKDASGSSLPYLDALAISFIKDPEVNFLDFVKGKFDYLSGLKGSYKDEILDANGHLVKKYKDKFKLIRSPYLNSEYLGFNLDTNFHGKGKNPLLDIRIRRAINYGFDREKMLRYLRNGIGIPATSGFIPKGLAAFDPQKTIGYTFQPDSTIQLLKEAGYPKGEGLPSIVLSTTAQYVDICKYLQHELRNFGIPIDIEVNQAATNNELIANNKAAFFRKSWVADYPDAENYLSLFLSQNFAPTGPNYTHYQNPKYDHLFAKAMSVTNDSSRIIIYQKLDQMIIKDAAIVPLFYDEVVRFIPKTISGIGVNSMNLLVLKYTKKSNSN